VGGTGEILTGYIPSPVVLSRLKPVKVKGETKDLLVKV
jgi:hypothetical protein